MARLPSKSQEELRKLFSRLGFIRVHVDPAGEPAPSLLRLLGSMGLGLSLDAAGVWGSEIRFRVSGLGSCRFPMGP